MERGPGIAVRDFVRAINGDLEAGRNDEGFVGFSGGGEWGRGFLSIGNGFSTLDRLEALSHVTGWKHYPTADRLEALSHVTGWKHYPT